VSDVFDRETRSSVMKAVKAKGNKSTELRLITLFKEYNISGWRRNYPVKGHPDFVFLQKKVAVFVDGCFWHGHDCRNTKPKGNEAYWGTKIARNKKHDVDITRLFQARGWVVVRIWECQLTKNKSRESMEKLLSVFDLK